ncbi:MAG TPA: hypothetical protein VM010_06425 [Chitinophagaceae bacterium]|nr:hypothetical protein [Chitinophagaceae bacterium]
MEVLALLQNQTFPLTEAQRKVLLQALALYINELIANDFNQLVQLLYRIDIDEKKLKGLLQQYQYTDAAPLIAALILERQEEKAAHRQQQKSKPLEDSDEPW